MVHPRLVTCSIITGQHRAVVIDLEFPAACRRVFVRVDVLDLVGRGGFAEIRSPSKEIDTGFLRQRQRGRHGCEEQTAEVVDVDPARQVGDDFLHARRPIAFFCPNQGDGFAGFTRQ